MMSIALGTFLVSSQTGTFLHPFYFTLWFLSLFSKDGLCTFCHLKVNNNKMIVYSEFFFLNQAIQQKIMIAKYVFIIYK